MKEASIDFIDDDFDSVLQFVFSICDGAFALVCVAVVCCRARELREESRSEREKGRMPCREVALLCAHFVPFAVSVLRLFFFTFMDHTTICYILGSGIDVVAWLCFIVVFFTVGNLALIRYAWIVLFIVELALLLITFVDENRGNKISLTVMVASILYCLSIICLAVASFVVKRMGDRSVGEYRSPLRESSESDSPAINKSAQYTVPEVVIAESPSIEKEKRMTYSQQADTRPGSLVPEGIEVNMRSTQISGQMPNKIMVTGWEPFVESGETYTRFIIRVHRNSGVTTAKRRCSEFRCLLTELKHEMPECALAALPLKYAPGTKPELEERRKILQAFFENMLSQHIYNREVHLFLKPEHEVQKYFKRISKRNIKRKHKAPVPAPPSNSILDAGAPEPYRESLMGLGELDTSNILHETVNNTVIPSSESSVVAAVPVPVPPKSAYIPARAPQAEPRTSDFMETLQFRARIQDTKLIDGRMVYTIIVSTNLTTGSTTVKLSSDMLKVLHNILVKKYKKQVMDLPRDFKSQDHVERVANYLNCVLGHPEMKKEEDVKRAFKLKSFYEQAEYESKYYQVVHLNDQPLRHF